MRGGLQKASFFGKRVVSRLTIKRLTSSALFFYFLYVIPAVANAKSFTLFFFSLSEVVSAEPFYKPVPKPRSSVLNKLVQLDKNLKGTVLKVSQTAERQRTPSDDSRSDSLSSPTHENLQCVSGERSPDESHSHDTPTASTGSPSQGDGEDGNFNSNPLVVPHQSLSIRVINTSTTSSLRLLSSSRSCF